MIKALNAERPIRRDADRLKRFGAAAVMFAFWTIMAPSSGSAQPLHIDNNTTVTAAVGPVTWGDVVAGFNSGTVSGVPGGTYIVPAGANVTLTNLFAGFAPNSSGLVTVNGGNITAVNPASQYYIGFSAAGTLVATASREISACATPGDAPGDILKKGRSRSGNDPRHA